MTMHKIFILLLGLCLSAVSYSREEKDTVAVDGKAVTGMAGGFSSGNDYAFTKSESDSLYAVGMYKDAAAGYEWLLENKGISPEVYYNLGNCYFRLNDNARAILNYERVLKLVPSDENAKANLELAYSKTVDKYETANEMFYTRWFNAVKHLFPSDTWAVFSIAVFILFLASLALFLWGRSSGLKKTGFFSGIAFLVLCIAGNVMAFSQRSDALAGDSAIVMVPSLTARSTPSDGGTALFVIHEGTKVSVTDRSMKSWIEISINSSQRGWVPVESVEII